MNDIDAAAREAERSIEKLGALGVQIFTNISGRPLYTKETLPLFDLMARYDLPAPVLGGLLVALAVSLLCWDGQDALRFDTTLQAPLMVAFFTTVGFGASLRLLRVGGVQVAWFLGIATVAALAQNLLGAGLATAMGLPPLLGVLAGSVTLTGGPATGLAFAPLFEQGTTIGSVETVTPDAPSGRAFDTVVLFTNSFGSAWQAKRAGIAERWGFAASGRSWLLTRAVHRPR